MVEIKMAEIEGKSAPLTPTCMESVNRIVKLPVVESSIQTASNVYVKVKDLNGYAKWGLETMENTLHTFVETGKPYAMPVVQKLDGPIKKVDSVLCSGLDYVEAKVPAVKLPPGELYNSTKGYVTDTVSPKVDAAYKLVDPTIQAAKHAVDPAVQAAKKVTDPAVDAAYKIMEPMVQPAVDRAHALKDYSVHKVQEFLHRETIPEEGAKDVVLYSQPHPVTSFLSAWSIALYNFQLYSDDAFPYIHFIFNFQFMMVENCELTQ